MDLGFWFGAALLVGVFCFLAYSRIRARRRYVNHLEDLGKALQGDPPNEKRTEH